MPNPKENTETKFVRDVVQNDVFEIGGLLYQVVGIATNAFDEVIMHLSLLALQKPYDKAPATNATLILPKSVMLDVHVD